MEPTKLIADYRKPVTNIGGKEDEVIFEQKEQKEQKMDKHMVPIVLLDKDKKQSYSLQLKETS